MRKAESVNYSGNLDLKKAARGRMGMFTQMGRLMVTQHPSGPKTDN